MEIKLINGGNMPEKGYEYSIFLTVPTIFLSASTRGIIGGKFKTTAIDFPTCFLLTRNNVYVYTNVCLLGFGLGLKINSRSD